MHCHYNNYYHASGLPCWERETRSRSRRITTTSTTTGERSNESSWRQLAWCHSIRFGTYAILLQYRQVLQATGAAVARVYRRPGAHVWNQKEKKQNRTGIKHRIIRYVIIVINAFNYNVIIGKIEWNSLYYDIAWSRLKRTFPYRRDVSMGTQIYNVIMTRTPRRLKKNLLSKYPLGAFSNNLYPSFLLIIICHHRNREIMACV